MQAGLQIRHLQRKWDRTGHKCEDAKWELAFTASAAWPFKLSLVGFDAKIVKHTAQPRACGPEAQAWARLKRSAGT